MTYHNQAIPLPYGMRALEELDMKNIVPFLIGNCDLPIGVPPAPDVSGEKYQFYTFNIILFNI